MTQARRERRGFHRRQLCPPDEQSARALAAVHVRLAAQPGLPAFEGIYATFAELRNSPAESAGGLVHHDAKLTFGPQGRSPVEWTTLSQHGVTVRGPASADLGVHIDRGELTAWTLDNLDRYWVRWVTQGRRPVGWTALAMLTDWGWPGECWASAGSTTRPPPARSPPRPVPDGTLSARSVTADARSSRKPCGADPAPSRNRTCAAARGADAGRRWRSWTWPSSSAAGRDHPAPAVRCRRAGHDRAQEPQTARPGTGQPHRRVIHRSAAAPAASPSSRGRRRPGARGIPAGARLLPADARRAPGRPPCWSGTAECCGYAPRCRLPARSACWPAARSPGPYRPRPPRVGEDLSRCPGPVPVATRCCGGGRSRWRPHGRGSRSWRRCG
jgi:hypothetical protein